MPPYRNITGDSPLNKTEMRYGRECGYDTRRRSEKED